MHIREVTLQTSDGLTLRGTHYDASSDSVLLIASALGVKRRYYDAFAQRIAESGRSVVTFDYRGIGDSRPKSLRSFDGTMEEWGRLDITAAIEWVSSELRPKTLAYVGHSCGGQLLGLAPNAPRVDQIIFTSAQSGYWRHWPGSSKYRLGALWVTMPLVASVIGYFPSKVLGLGSEDLPRRVAVEWARWGRHPEYIFGYHDPAPYARITAPLLGWSFVDDTYAPKAAVDALLAHYSSADITRRHTDAPGIGHFGFFRRGKGERLWDEAVTWLAARTVR
ncbi:MAG TPA: alpha/beta fold hydrolase [Thermoanaerobaculia bacterium]|jgi:predicted alpha/beta hydrolase|nr:alpha/beta fold hydrolase [Thermoanaerobaculia bacterium]